MLTFSLMPLIFADFNDFPTHKKQQQQQQQQQNTKMFGIKFNLIRLLEIII